MRPTQFICEPRDGMQLRSGRVLNNITNSDLYNDMNHLINFSFTNKSECSFISYCNNCYQLIGLLYIVEKYGMELRGDTNRMKGDDMNFSKHQKIYVTIRDKIQEFIENIDTNYVSCYCNENHGIYLNDPECYEIYTNCMISIKSKYKHMENYTGYGPKRELYRQYHDDFMKLEESDDGEISSVRDFQKVRDELAHWLKYFNQTHYSIIRKTKKALNKTKITKKLNNDCISHIISFL